MYIESRQTSIRASIQEHLNTLRAKVYRNTLIASFKNYMGRHDQQMHTTLFNIANPTEGVRKAGAGGEGVRGRAADDGDEGATIARGQAGYAGYGERARTQYAAEVKAGRLAGESDADYVDRMLVSARALAYGDNFVARYKFSRKAEPSEEQVRQAMAPRTGGQISRAQELFEKNSRDDQDALVSNAYDTLRAIKNTDAAGKLLPSFRESKYHNEYLNRVLGEAGLNPNAIRKLTLEQRNTVSDKVRAMRIELQPAKGVMRAARSDWKIQRNELERLEAGLAFMKRPIALSKLTQAKINAEELAKGSDIGIVESGPAAKKGATQEQVNAQKPVVAMAKEKLDAATGKLKAQRETLLVGLRGVKKTVALEGRHVYIKPTLENYETNRQFFLQRQSTDPKNLANTRQAKMWVTYHPALTKAEPKSAEAAAYAFTKIYFRALAGRAIAGPGGKSQGNFKINDPRLKKYSKNITQEDFDKLWGMVGRAEQAKASGRTPQEMKEARGEMEAFLIKTFGATPTDVARYKELSDFQFSYKMLRQISSDLDILKSYNNQGRFSNIGSVVKQNMARYFMI